MNYSIEGTLKVDPGGDREDPLSPGDSRSRPFRTYIPDASDLDFSCGPIPASVLDPDPVAQWGMVLDLLHENGFEVVEIQAEP